MKQAVEILGLFAETPLHPGTGSTTGVVDLPVQRERHTEFPSIQASSLKGAMREVAERNDKEKTNIIFGGEGNENAGALSLTDARILVFPVRSLSNVFVWVTCPMVIKRFERDVALLKSLPTSTAGKLDKIAALQGLDEIEQETALITNNSKLKGKLFLEELLFCIDETKKKEVSKLATDVCKLIPKGKVHEATIKKLEEDLVVISNQDFTHIVKNATQVSARVVLNDNKTSNNLWYEESLPPDTLFYTLLIASPPRLKDEKNKSGIKDAAGVLSELKKMVSDYLQIGGNETLGMGWCALRYFPQEAADG